MRRRKRKLNKRLLLRLLLRMGLLLSLCIGLFWAGSSAVSFLIGKDDAAHAAHTEASAPAASGSDDPGTAHRLHRLLFLKEAVRQSVRPARYVAISDTPPALRQAFVAVEDRRFYEHHGFDPGGIARAMFVNLQSGEIEEGASTITQQLAKNLFLSQEQTFGRKAEELLLALDLEWNYSKDEILELYLNSIYFGSGYYGIYDAAQGYFGMEPSELKLPESTMLAGLPNAPSLYSPYVDFLAAKKRQFIVLDAMHDSGFISEKLCEDAKIRPINLVHGKERN